MVVVVTMAGSVLTVQDIISILVHVVGIRYSVKHIFNRIIFWVGKMEFKDIADVLNKVTNALKELSTSFNGLVNNVTEMINNLSYFNWFNCMSIFNKEDIKDMGG